MMYSFKINKLKQLNFIKISADKNPIHLIEKNLSKLNLEGTVVHGMNVVLKSLDMLTKEKIIKPSQIYQIKCKFAKMIFLDEVIKINFNFENKKKIFISIYSKGVLCIILELFFNNKLLTDENIKLKNKIINSLPKNNSLKHKKKLIKINHVPLIKQISKSYPYLSKNLNYKIISSLIMMSTSVGMYWPGKNSLFVGFNIFLKKIKKKDINLKILKTDNRTGYSIINYKSYNCIGKIFTFFTQERAQQPSLTYLSKRIPKRALIKHKALIIGGSRGLGELTAKIIATSGGNVTITYNNNQMLAKNLLKIFNKRKLRLRIKKFKINKNGNFNNKTLKNCNYNCLYYFATPLIYRQKNIKFDKKIFRDFNNIYSKALIKIIKSLKIKNLIIFYPSTVYNFRKNKNFSEYIHAKRDGVNKLKNMERKFKIVPVIKKLPPFKTDQNNTIFSQNISHGTNEIFKICIEIERKIYTNELIKTK